jgi:hypothetical protein
LQIERLVEEPGAEFAHERAERTHAFVARHVSSGAGAWHAPTSPPHLNTVIVLALRVEVDKVRPEVEAAVFIFAPRMEDERHISLRERNRERL